MSNTQLWDFVSRILSPSHKEWVTLYLQGETIQAIAQKAKKPAPMLRAVISAVFREGIEYYDLLYADVFERYLFELSTFTAMSGEPAEVFRYLIAAHKRGTRRIASIQNDNTVPPEWRDALRRSSPNKQDTNEQPKAAVTALEKNTSEKAKVAATEKKKTAQGKKATRPATYRSKDSKTYQRIKNRVLKQFDSKYYLGDISVRDNEYTELLSYARAQILHIADTQSTLTDAPLLAVALIQIGIRCFNGNYWSNAAKELGLSGSQLPQTLVGKTFIQTLNRHNKYIVSENERVHSIMFHAFVSNYYSKGLFELLFQYYVRDLERDIYRNTTEQMQVLMDTLAKKATLDEKQSEAFADQFMERGSRAYKLRFHTLQAISAYPVHSRMRLRRLLRLIDKAFWNGSTPKEPTSRLTIQFKEWLEDSAAFKKEYRLYQLGEIRNRGKKHFSTPYLFANIGAEFFELKLPTQIVAEEFAENLEWEITTSVRTFRLDAETYPVLTGYKTEEGKTRISQRELFGDIQCKLICNEQIVRKFPYLPKSNIRFFDMEGDYAPRLFRIPMCAYTPVDCTLHSKALLCKVPNGSMTRWDFDFQQGDLVVLPDGSGMIVGDYYSDGLVPRGRVTCADYNSEADHSDPVYANVPELLLTIPKGKFAGTVLYCNDVRYRLADCQYNEFENRDSRGVHAILLPLEQFSSCNADGLKRIVLDIPGSANDREYRFVLVNGLDVKFPGAPYVFEEKGVVLFPPHIQLSGNYEKLQGENGYQFALSGNNTALRIVVNDSIPLSIRIPVLLWSADKLSWNVLPAGELWHTDFFTMQKLYLQSPVNKIRVSTDADIEDEDNVEHTIIAESGADGVFTVDMTRFRSWLTREVMKNDILLKLGSQEYVFATVYTKSLVASYDVSADYEAGTLTWLSDIIGKAEYFLDIVHLETGTVLADKKQLCEGKLVLNDRLRSGKYKFTLYEAEEDDSGFDDLIYEELLSTERQLTNSNDVSGQFLEIRSFKAARNSNLYTSFLHQYYAAGLEKIGKNVYEGVLFADGTDTGIAVTLEFLNPGDMRYFHVTAWHVEEECNVDLLYDRANGTLELDQLPGLRSSESFRRYRELSYGDIVYFGILHSECPEYQPTISVRSETTVFQTANPNSGKYGIPIEQIGLSVRSCNILRRAKILNTADIQAITPEQWYRIRNMGKKSIEEIIAVMDRFGLEVQRPFPATTEKVVNALREKETTPNTPVQDLAEALSDSHVFPETNQISEDPQQIKPEEKPINPHKVPIAAMGFSSEACRALAKRGVEYSGNLEALTQFEWYLIRKEIGDISDILQKMQELGLRAKK